MLSTYTLRWYFYVRILRTIYVRQLATICKNRKKTQLCYWVKSKIVRLCVPMSVNIARFVHYTCVIAFPCAGHHFGCTVEYIASNSKTIASHAAFARIRPWTARHDAFGWTTLLRTVVTGLLYLFIYFFFCYLSICKFTKTDAYLYYQQTPCRF